MILIPVKNLADAKQRLSAVLSPAERQQLARAMCEDVLDTVARWQGKTGVAVVTSDPFARELAARFDFRAISDDSNPGETGAIEMATAICKKLGASRTLVLPADIPLIEAGELQAIMDAAESAASVLVPDAAGRGSNAVLRTPADLFPLRFGNDSFLPHLAAARATGLPCTVLELPGIARDIDRPEDLHEVAAAQGERRTQKLLRSWNFDRCSQVCCG